MKTTFRLPFKLPDMNDTLLNESHLVGVLEHLNWFRADLFVRLCWSTFSLGLTDAPGNSSNLLARFGNDPKCRI